MSVEWEWLREAFPHGGDPSALALVLRLTAALLLGCIVAGVYHVTRRPSTDDTPTLVPTLVLLTVLIAMITLVIGDSTARAFSLVGALAIVRFRTVVEDTRDTAFVIFAVAVGMALGAGFLSVVLVGMPVATIAALLFRQRGAPAVRGTAGHSLSVRLGVGLEPESVLREAFTKHLADHRLLSIATARQGAALDLSYVVRLRSEGSAAALVSEMNRIEGVQSVELRQD